MLVIKLLAYPHDLMVSNKIRVVGLYQALLRIPNVGISLVTSWLLQLCPPPKYTILTQCPLVLNVIVVHLKDSVNQNKLLTISSSW